uniref:Uncharacterized protein n=1 Tax=Glossina brevipalpis TaxID=37001 RepID=A0A1A9WM50_9MUSC
MVYNYIHISMRTNKHQERIKDLHTKGGVIQVLLRYPNNNGNRNSNSFLVVLCIIIMMLKIVYGRDYNTPMNPTQCACLQCHNITSTYNRFKPSEAGGWRASLSVALLKKLEYIPNLLLQLTLSSRNAYAWNMTFHQVDVLKDFAINEADRKDPTMTIICCRFRLDILTKDPTTMTAAIVLNEMLNYNHRTNIYHFLLEASFYLNKTHSKSSLRATNSAGNTLTL